MPCQCCRTSMLEHVSFYISREEVGWEQCYASTDLFCFTHTPSSETNQMMLVICLRSKHASGWTSLLLHFGLQSRYWSPFNTIRLFHDRVLFFEPQHGCQYHPQSGDPRAAFIASSHYQWTSSAQQSCSTKWPCTIFWRPCTQFSRHTSNHAPVHSPLRLWKLFKFIYPARHWPQHPSMRLPQTRMSGVRQFGNHLEISCVVFENVLVLICERQCERRRTFGDLSTYAFETLYIYIYYIHICIPLCI